MMTKSYRKHCDWTTIHLLLGLLTLSTLSLANPVLITEESICMLMCPDGQSSCDVCQQIITILQTANKPQQQQQQLRRRSRSFCENQCRMGLRGSYGAGCGCGHDPTRKRSSGLEGVMSRNGIGNGAMIELNDESLCFVACQSGQSPPLCDCPSVTSQFLQGNSGQRWDQLQMRNPSLARLTSGFNCDFLCAAGLSAGKCQCADV